MIIYEKLWEKMKEENMDIEQISRFTNLTIDEIKQL